jgi:hypothetical protein
MVYRILTILLIASMICCSASAQIQNPGVVQVGPVVPGNCTKWVGVGQIADAGAPCGSGGGGTCTGTVDFSTGCVQPSLGGF